jgi:hypothetical protein
MHYTTTTRRASVRGRLQPEKERYLLAEQNQEVEEVEEEREEAVASPAEKLR